MKIAGEDALQQNIVETKRYIEEHSGVQSFNGRSGSVLPMAGDYSAEQVNYDSNQTVKQKIDALVTKETSDITGQQSLLKDTVGWTGKNLLKNTATSQTINGVTFTVNDDGSITANGTATGIINFIVSDVMPFSSNSTYILNGCPAGGIYTTYRLDLRNSVGQADNDLVDYGDGCLCNKSGDYYVNIRIASGATVSNLTFYPMLRRADITDPTYEPYHESVEAELDQVKSYLGILTTPVPSYVANTLPVLKRNITNAFYNGSLRAEIAAGNFKNVRPGDYIIGQATGSTYYVAMCDYRLGKGDQTNNTNYPAYGTHHLGLMLFKPVGTTALWRGYGDANKSWRVGAADLGRCPWNAATDADPTNTEAVGANNTNITRTYNGANVSGYMGSFIRERIDAVLLPQCFQADFGSANVLKYRERNGDAVVTDKPSGGQGNWNGCTSAWNWYDRYLDLPSEVELYGSRIFGSGFDHGCQCEQLPIFRNAAIHDFYPRIDIWTKAVASSSNAANRNNFGSAFAGLASSANWACPLACVR